MKQKDLKKKIKELEMQIEQQKSVHKDFINIASQLVKELLNPYDIKSESQFENGALYTYDMKHNIFIKQMEQLDRKDTIKFNTMDKSYIIDGDNILYFFLNVFRNDCKENRIKIHKTKQSKN